jgi:hypothetical protein
MESFKAEAVFEFETKSLETASQDLRRLAEAARESGFMLRKSRVEPLPPAEPGKPGTSYVPLDPS